MEEVSFPFLIIVPFVEMRVDRFWIYLREFRHQVYMFENRLFFLNQIIDSFLDLISSSKRELKAKLISSKELSKTELEEICNELSKDFQSPIKIDYKHDPDLIGGLVIQVGSVMVDTSIKSKLKQLQKSMIEA